MKKNTVLIVDGGGRGAALVDGYAKSPHVSKILVVPGNDLVGINTKKEVKTFPSISTTQILEIISICKKEKVDLVDVAHDNAVEAGLVDALVSNGFNVVGPTKNAGQIEWDKAWSREFMKKYAIPHPAFKICNSEKEGIEFIKKQKNNPWFIKASGLAGGKGVLPAKDNKEALEKIREMSQFGSAGKTFLIEQALVGEEFSLFAICDGEDYKILGLAQDYKREANFDIGANTGGMGCVSPPQVVTSTLLKTIQKTILDPTVEGLKNENRPYKGILYLGGMIVSQNGVKKIYVIEFNARWGDPEVQVVLPGLVNDLFELSTAVVNKGIKKVKIKRDTKTRVVVAGVSRGYPHDHSKVNGKQIFGIDEVLKLKNIKFYSAAVKSEKGKYMAFGGRLFYIVGEGKNVIEARKKAYETLSSVFIEGNNLHYRTDIGWRDVERLKAST